MAPWVAMTNTASAVKKGSVRQCPFLISGIRRMTSRRVPTTPAMRSGPDMNGDVTLLIQNGKRRRCRRLLDRNPPNHGWLGGGGGGGYLSSNEVTCPTSAVPSFAHTSTDIS